MRFATFCLLVLLVPCSAVAQEPQAPTQEQVTQARMLYEQGLLAFDQERWEDCAIDFEQSFTFVFSPDLLYNIGRCYEEAANISHDRNHYHRAIVAYVRYIRDVPTADSVPIDLKIQRLRDELGALPPELVDDPAPTVPHREKLPILFPMPVDYALGGTSHGPDDLFVYTPEPEFAWTYTLLLGGATAAVAIASLVTGIVANKNYNELAATCGATAEGCNPYDVSRVGTLATTTTVLLGVSAALLVSTGIAFFIEFSEQNTADPAIEALGLQFSRSF